MGSLTSTPFTINKPYLNFRIGGQDNAGLNKVRLMVGGQPVKEVGPPQDNGFVDVSWSVSSWNGQTGQIVCEDGNFYSSYAWFCVDEFHLSDTPTTTPSKPVVRAGDGPAFRSDLPDTFAVAQNVPNPFNPATMIGYALPRTSDVKLVVYNVLGQEVRRLIDGRVGAGQHQVVWDARDDLGRAVSSGLYSYRFTAGPVDEVKKMLILK